MRTAWLICLIFIIGCGEAPKRTQQAPPPTTSIPIQAEPLAKAESNADEPVLAAAPAPTAHAKSKTLSETVAELKSLYDEITRCEAIKDQEQSEEARQEYEKTVLKPMRERAADLAGQIVELKQRENTSPPSNTTDNSTYTVPASGTAMSSPPSNSADPAIGVTPHGYTIYEGPRGGQYHISPKSGKKVYEKPKK